MLTLECIRGGEATEKCPVQPADLVLIHNYVLQALAKPENELNDDFDFWASLPNIKGPFIKHFQVFQARLGTVLHDYRIETDP